MDNDTDTDTDEDADLDTDTGSNTDARPMIMQKKVPPPLSKAPYGDNFPKLRSPLRWGGA